MTTAFNMRSPGIRLHKLILFAWAVVITAVLLLLSLPVLAGKLNLPALNLAVFWEQLYESISQPAGNLLSLNFLENLRGYTPKYFCCSLQLLTFPLCTTVRCIHTDNNSNNLNKSLFSSYLTGLIEGDGTIITPKTLISPKGKLNYPAIQIVFHLKDLPLALLVQKELGVGSLSRKKGVDGYILTINSYEGILLVISLVNGNMRTPKIHSLNALIDFLNNTKETSIEKHPVCIDSIDSNPWLSGFIEADASFQVRTTLSGKYPSPAMWSGKSQTVGVKQSNYGDTHIIESAMDNRVAKSACLLLNFTSSVGGLFQKINNAVKVQRVDGCWQVGGASCLRNTLTGFVKNPRTKIPSKQINVVRFYSSANDKLITMNPWFVTGFSDGEGCFMIYIRKNSKYSTGWTVQLVFRIGLHKKDAVLLYSIQKFFGVGKIYHEKDVVYYQVFSNKHLLLIRDHFDKYPLITQKFADYCLFKKAFDIVKNKQHLSKQGLREIVSLKASLNRGLSPILENSFANIISYPRPSVSDFKIRDPQWLAGFASADGCFLIRILKSSTSLTGYQIVLVFKLTQHFRDQELFRSLVDYLGCGNVYLSETAVDYVVTKLTDITDKIVPLFQKNSIQGVKYLDFLAFVSIVELMNNKVHLTEKGVNQIKEIKAGMNKGRDN